MIITPATRKYGLKWALSKEVPLSFGLKQIVHEIEQLEAQGVELSLETLQLDIYQHPDIANTLVYRFAVYGEDPIPEEPTA